MTLVKLQRSPSILSPLFHQMSVLILKLPTSLNHTVVVLYLVLHPCPQSLSCCWSWGSVAWTMLLFRSYLHRCLWSPSESATLGQICVFQLSQYSRPCPYRAQRDFQLLYCPTLFSDSFTSLYLIILLNMHIHINKKRSSDKSNAFVTAPGKCCLQKDV